MYNTFVYNKKLYNDRGFLLTVGYRTIKFIRSTYSLIFDRAVYSLAFIRATYSLMFNRAAYSLIYIRDIIKVIFNNL